MRWAGHMAIQNSKTTFRSQLKNGLKKVGAPQKRYKDSLKAHLKDFNIDAFTWEDCF